MADGILQLFQCLQHASVFLGQGMQVFALVGGNQPRGESGQAHHSRDVDDLGGRGRRQLAGVQARGIQPPDQADDGHLSQQQSQHGPVAPQHDGKHQQTRVCQQCGVSQPLPVDGQDADGNGQCPEHPVGSQVNTLVPVEHKRRQQQHRCNQQADGCFAGAHHAVHQAHAQ